MARRDNQRTFQDLPEQKMAAEHNEVPLNAIRVFVTIAREGSVTRAASTLGTTQSSVSHYLAVLQDYFGTDLVQRRGRRNELTEFGRLFANAVTEPLDTVCFTAKRMRRRIRTDANRLVVHTSLSTFAYSFLIPNLQTFSAEMGGVVVDVISSLSPPRSSDNFDVMGKTLSTVHSTPILNITSRPDILPTWLRAMNLSAKDIKLGARYDHNYLALPAAMTGKCLLVAPEIVVSDLVRTGALHVIPGSRTSSGMQYRAYAVDRSDNPEIARAFLPMGRSALQKGRNSGRRLTAYSVLAEVR